MCMLARLTANLLLLICTPYCEIKMSAGNFGSQVIFFAICFGLMLPLEEGLQPLFLATLIYLIEVTFAKFPLCEYFLIILFLSFCQSKVFILPCSF